MASRFRNLTSFGKRIEFWIIGEMLREGLDVYVPLVDDIRVDAIVRKPDAQFVEVQVKARSKDVADGNAALFAAISHEKRDNYWFVFYSERMNTMWILSSDEFIEGSYQNKTGKNAGKRSISFNGKRKNRITGEIEEYTKPKFEKYIETDFSRILK